MDKVEKFFTELMSWVAAEQANHGAPLTVGHIVSVCATVVIEEYLPPIIAEKEREIERIKELLKEMYEEKWQPTLSFAQTQTGRDYEDVLNEYFDIYKKEHNL